MTGIFYFSSDPLMICMLKYMTDFRLLFLEKINILINLLYCYIRLNLFSEFMSYIIVL